MLVHRRVTPSIKFAGTHLYTWVERATVRVKCLAQEHNTMSPARARTRTTQSGDERTNHEATAPSTAILKRSLINGPGDMKVQHEMASWTSMITRYWKKHIFGESKIIAEICWEEWRHLSRWMKITYTWRVHFNTHSPMASAVKI